MSDRGLGGQKNLRNPVSGRVGDAGLARWEALNKFTHSTSEENVFSNIQASL